MEHFYMNGYLWRVFFVDPNSELLVDRTNTYRIATTDPVTYCIYLSDALEGDLLNKVLIHELGHCAMISFHLLDDIHRMVKRKYWIEAEEWVCNFLADYGLRIFATAYDILGDRAWIYVPRELERLVA